MTEKLNEIIGVVGLGYVGLPLAAAFGRVAQVVGFDRSEERVKELQSGSDHTGEVSRETLVSGHLQFTCDPQDLKTCTFIIVAVPTPVTADHVPDLTPLISASETIGSILQPGQIVVYESTVYPGVTEKECLPILERLSGLTLGEFGLGYSPERINPGDKRHTVDQIVKVVSGHDEATTDRVEAVYASIISAGVHRAPDIRTAEASKVIENVQRDLNIALMNELSKIFDKAGINTRDVIKASATKWNFHAYTPGLVGGHCIGVDPYYLTHLAEELDYNPEVILAGRRINDSMGGYVAELVLRELTAAGTSPADAQVLMMGMTFKENVPDLRNTKAIDVYSHLQARVGEVRVWEPLVEPAFLENAYPVRHATLDDMPDVDAIVLVNAHHAFSDVTLDMLKAKMRTPVIVDVKSFFPRDKALEMGFRYVSL